MRHTGYVEFGEITVPRVNERLKQWLTANQYLGEREHVGAGMKLFQNKFKNSTSIIAAANSLGIYFTIISKGDWRSI